MARSKDENNEYMRKYRAKKRAEAAQGLATITPLRAVKRAGLDFDASEPVVVGVAREIAAMPKATEQPGLILTALRLASVLDGPNYPQYAPCARALAEILTKLRGQEATGENKLTALRARRQTP